MTCNAQQIRIREAEAIGEPTLDIVVVDDEIAIAELLVELLDQEGFRASWASCAQDGLQQVIHGTPRLVLTDVMLPGTSGPALLTQISELGLAITPRSILMSAAPRPPEAPPGVPFIRKPFDLDYLLGIVGGELQEGADQRPHLAHADGLRPAWLPSRARYTSGAADGPMAASSPWRNR